VASINSFCKNHIYNMKALQGKPQKVLSSTYHRHQQERFSRSKIINLSYYRTCVGIKFEMGAELRWRLLISAQNRRFTRDKIVIDPLNALNEQQNVPRRRSTDIILFMKSNDREHRLNSTKVRLFATRSLE